MKGSAKAGSKGRRPLPQGTGLVRSRSHVFKVAVSGIPERKTDLAVGRYDLEGPDADSRQVAVKIIDMLGEEALITSLSHGAWDLTRAGRASNVPPLT